jgi:hypothetical protein
MATILAGQTSVTVTDTLSSAPLIQNIILTPQDDLGGRTYWPSNVTATTFQININTTDPFTAHTFAWAILAAPAAPTPPSPPGAFPIVVADVQSFLNATYDDVNLVYSVYGLDISSTTFQAGVVYANNYIVSILGYTPGPTDPKYPMAYLAALDLACLRILVTSTGGSLTGAFDYFLGDLRVTRAAPYATAIKNTIAGLKIDLVKMMSNLSIAVMTANARLGREVPSDRGGLMGP